MSIRKIIENNDDNNNAIIISTGTVDMRRILHTKRDRPIFIEYEFLCDRFGSSGMTSSGLRT